MKITIITVLFTILAFNLDAQDIWSWAENGNCSDDDYSYEIAIDKNENIVYCGLFMSDTLFIGTDTLINEGISDLFIAKCDAYGNPIWAKSFGDDVEDVAYSVAVDNYNNIYCTGHFNDSLIFGSDTLKSSGDADVFLAKFNSEGVPVWAVKGGGTDAERSNKVYVDESSVYISGYFTGNASFDAETLNTTGSDDIFAVKYDLNGNLIWARKAGSSSWDRAYGLTVDLDGNVYVTGWFCGAFGFGASSLSYNGSYDFFLLKWQSDGTPEWGFSAGSNLEDEGFSVTTDSSGYVYVTGNFHSNSMNFGGTTINSNGDRDLLIAKFNSSGSVEWVRNLGGNGQDRGEDVKVDYNGDLVIAGWYGSSDFDFMGEALDFNGTFDVLVCKMDTTGNDIWSKTVGGSDNDRSVSIVTDSINDIYIAGSYLSSEIDFGLNPIGNNGGSDYFVSKIAFCDISISLGDDVDSCGTAIIDAGIGYEIYTWNSIEGEQSLIVNETGNYNLIVQDFSGCTASDDIYVTIYSLPEMPVITQVENQLVSNQVDGNQWYESGEIIIGETSQYFTPSHTGYYSVIYTDENGCFAESEEYSFIGDAITLNSYSGICVYPNPVKDKISVCFKYEGSKDTEFEYWVYNVDSKQILNGKNKACDLDIGTCNLKIDICDLPPAYYIIRFWGGGKIYTAKFVKE